MCSGEFVAHLGGFIHGRNGAGRVHGGLHDGLETLRNAGLEAVGAINVG